MLEEVPIDRRAPSEQTQPVELHRRCNLCKAATVSAASRSFLLPPGAFGPKNWIP